MLIKPEEINGIIRKAGEVTAERGKKYYEQDKIRIKKVKYKSEDNYKVYTYVKGNYIYEPFISRDKGILRFACNCPTFTDKRRVCKHIVATTFDMYVSEEKYLEASKEDLTFSISEEEKLEKNRYKNEINKNIKHIGLLDYYENLSDEISNASFNIEIRPVIKEEILNELSVYFKVGSKKFYNIKDLSQFAKAIKSKDVIEYGKNFAFRHDISNFNDNSKKVAMFIAKKVLEYENYALFAKNELELKKEYKKFLALKYNALDEFFDIYKNSNCMFENEKEVTYMVRFIEEDPLFNFQIKEEEKFVSILHKNEDYKVYYGSSNIYILMGNVLYKCSQKFREEILPLIEEFKKSKTDKIQILKENANVLFENVIPTIEKSSTVILNEELKTKYKTSNLGVKVFLDLDAKKNIVAEVKYCYDDVQFNPYDFGKKVAVSRNKRQEERVSRLFDEYRFRIDADKHMLYLSNEDYIYQFFKTGIDKFMEKFEVLVTEKLKNITTINNNSINMGVKLNSGLIDIKIDNMNFDEKELKEIFENYRLKKKYYRLKDGSFINLDSSVVATLYNFSQNLGITYKDIISNNIKVPKYRAVYLESIGKNSENVVFEKDDGFKMLINDISNLEKFEFDIPKLNFGKLRQYQKDGYNWLKTLDKYSFGGILADDMGLGKTLQVITLLLSQKDNVDESNSTSIVITPSSLYINWENEIKKFAPTLKTLVVSGPIEERRQKIKSISNYDVVLTSYDLLKRDIAEYGKFNFRYVIADEAQYIKNNNTKNAKALKQLNGKVRFALTGTPIENSLAELWSIFDFVMPGYLYSYRKFRETFETPIIKDGDDNSMKKLQSMVAPFILRRTKDEVLKELPEKTVTVMYNEMEETQSKIYYTYLLSAKREVKEELEKMGSQFSNIKVLALITRLRQIASYPGLFLENYDDESSKVNQCIELVKEAVGSGHKLLIFSSFASIFDILEAELNKNGIKYFKLTGKTKVDTRVEMVDNFNKSEDIPVFLVSLKAGGTGLNLIGADMVIHFDPWWNLSQENQATDRAYRIGQRKNVQVFKLITKGTIEEKIQELQDRKSKMIDDVIKSGETLITKMSKEEILKLFE